MCIRDRTSFDFPPVDRERAFSVVDAMRQIAEAHDCSVARIAQAWLLQQPGFTSIIIGAKTMTQLENNLQATSLTLTSTELETLDSASALLVEYPTWMETLQNRDRMVLPD